MKRKNKLLKYFIYALLLILLGGRTFMKRVPKPEIKKAEFQFKLEYELDGGLMVVEDVLVCNFKGISIPGSNGRQRLYDKHLKSEKRKRDILLRQLENGQKLYYYTGYPALYMGDTKTKNVEAFNTVYSAKDDDPTSAQKMYNNKSYEDLGVKLISWTVDAPIENKFE